MTCWFLNITYFISWTFYDRKSRNCRKEYLELWFTAFSFMFSSGCPFIGSPC